MKLQVGVTLGLYRGSVDITEGNLSLLMDVRRIRATALGMLALKSSRVGT